MSKLIVAVAAIAIASGSVAMRRSLQAKSSASPASYLNFEIGARENGYPNEWAGGGPASYKLTLDKSESHTGAACGRIEGTTPSPGEFGTFTTAVDASNYVGRKVRYTGWIKSDNITDGWAGMWLRIDGAGGLSEILGFDNMHDRAITGTTGWKQYTIEMDVPKGAKKIFFGFLLAGNGTLRGDDLKIEAVGAKPKPAIHGKKVAK